MQLPVGKAPLRAPHPPRPAIAAAAVAWELACGEKPLRPVDGRLLPLEDYARFPVQNRPHRDRGFTVKQAKAHKHVLGPIKQAVQRAVDAGVPLTAVMNYVESVLRDHSMIASLRTHLAEYEDGDDGHYVKATQLHRIVAGR